MEKESTKNMSFFSGFSQRIEALFHSWLLHERKRTELPLQDFNKMCQNLLPADVLLFKGRSRISRAISFITHSHWTHAALYIGRCSDYDSDSEILLQIRSVFHGDEKEQLVVESLLGQGTVITPLSNYANDSIRLCRPRGIIEKDAELVVQHALSQLGREYDVRQLFDLARFMFPYAIFPRRWFSTLFNYKPGQATRTVCSTMLVESFMSVKFPVIPVIHQVNQNIAVHKRNPRIFTPQDFDYSPYFEIIKFPNINYDRSFLGIRTKGGYRELPWYEDENYYCNSGDECAMMEDEKSNQEKKEQSNKDMNKDSNREGTKNDKVDTEEVKS